MLWDRQAEAIRALKQRGITVKINTIIIPGVNEEHVPEVARRVAELGADIANCVPLYPVAGTALGTVEPPSPGAGRGHPGGSRPLAAHHGALHAVPGRRRGAFGRSHAAAQSSWPCSRRGPAAPDDNRPCVAVATMEGMLVNQHLGEAQRLAVYDRGPDGFRLIETRPTPPPGGGRDRWLALAKTLHDCRALLVASAGQAPLIRSG